MGLTKQWLFICAGIFVAMLLLTFLLRVVTAPAAPSVQPGSLDPTQPLAVACEAKNTSELLIVEDFTPEYRAVLAEEVAVTLAQAAAVATSEVEARRYEVLARDYEELGDLIVRPDVDIDIDDIPVIPDDVVAPSC